MRDADDNFNHLPSRYASFWASGSTAFVGPGESPDGRGIVDLTPQMNQVAAHCREMYGLRGTNGPDVNSQANIAKCIDDPNQQKTVIDGFAVEMAKNYVNSHVPSMRHSAVESGQTSWMVMNQSSRDTIFARSLEQDFQKEGYVTKWVPDGQIADNRPGVLPAFDLVVSLPPPR